MKEIELDNVNVNAPNGWQIGSLIGTQTNGSTSNILYKSGKIKGAGLVAAVIGYNEYSSNKVSNIIVENAQVNGNSRVQTVSGSTLNSDLVGTNLYYSCSVIKNDSNNLSGCFSNSNIGNISYYTGKVETMFNGDQNKTGYYFGYDSDENVALVKASDMSGVVSSSTGSSSGSGTGSNSGTVNGSCHYNIDMTSCSVTKGVTAKICSEKNPDKKYYWIPNDTNGSSTMLGKCFYSCNSC